MTQVLDRPPSTQRNTGSNFYLLAVSQKATLFWTGLDWTNSKREAKIFASYESAEKEQPQAAEKAPSGSTVIISPEI